MKLPSCVGETDQLLPGGPGSIKSHYDLLWDSLVAQKVKLCPQCRRPGFDPWAGKISWRRKWQPTPKLLPRKFNGWRSLVGYSSWGCKESDTTERLHYHYDYDFLVYAKTS